MFETRLSALKAADVEALIAGRQPEGLELEFKADFDGSPEGERARNDIAKEVVAFANAYGGTLIVGISEDDEGRAVASALVPNCVSTAKRIDDALRSDIIEPRLPSGFECQAVPVDGADTGYIVLRVPASLLGPHWLVKGKGIERAGVCYIRRNRSSQSAHMREIHDLVLDRSRRLSRLDEVKERLQKRSAAHLRRYLEQAGTYPDHPNYISVQLVAVPSSLVALDMEQIRSSHHSFDKAVNVIVDGKVEQLPMPEIDQNWRPQLRGYTSEGSSDADLVVVEKTCDGAFLVFWAHNASLYHSYCSASGKTFARRAYAQWFHAAVARTLATIANFRDQTGIGEIDYTLGVRIHSNGRWFLEGIQPLEGPLLPETEAIDFPHYLVQKRQTFQQVVSEFAADLANLVGKHSRPIHNIDWDQL